MPFNLSTGEIMVLLVVAILVFGGRLPEVARKVARGVGEFRRGMNEEMRRIDASTRIDDDAPPPEWTRPPDGADCDGFGRIRPEAEETPDAPEPAPEVEEPKP
jgi:sec-independent protein translocase protein TatA